MFPCRSACLSPCPKMVAACRTTPSSGHFPGFPGSISVTSAKRFGVQLPPCKPWARSPSALSPTFWGEGSPTKTDHRKELVPLFSPLYWRTQCFFLNILNHLPNSVDPSFTYYVGSQLFSFWLAKGGKPLVAYTERTGSTEK